MTGRLISIHVADLNLQLGIMEWKLLCSRQGYNDTSLSICCENISGQDMTTDVKQLEYEHLQCIASKAGELVLKTLA